MSEDLVAAITRLLARENVRVELTGSRAHGTAGRFSDWDFAVETDDFRGLADALPGLVAPLEPLAGQWDRLGVRACYMLILPGPVKIDLIFEDASQEEAPPWQVSEETLPRIDAHFWDWVLWLAAKADAGQDELVASELERMSRHLLAPMGVLEVPPSVWEARERYVVARGHWEGRLRMQVDRKLERAVVPVLSELEGALRSASTGLEARADGEEDTRTSPRFVRVRWLPLPWIGAMTLPPWGIFIRRGRDSPGLRRHEQVHWQQYVRHGFLGFYLGYLLAWIRCGFSYRRHPWEIEARRQSGTR